MVAKTEADKRKIAEATKQGVKVRDEQVKSTQVALADSRAELKDERSANAKTEAQLESRRKDG